MMAIAISNIGTKPKRCQTYPFLLIHFFKAQKTLDHLRLIRPLPLPRMRDHGLDFRRIDSAFEMNPPKLVAPKSAAKQRRVHFRRTGVVVLDGARSRVETQHARGERNGRVQIDAALCICGVGALGVGSGVVVVFSPPFLII